MNDGLLKKISWLVVFALFFNSTVPVWANIPITGAQGNQESGDTPTEEPIDTASGNNFFIERDLYVGTPGIPISFSRKYNSRETYESPLGQGWSSSFDWRLCGIDEQWWGIVPPVTNASFTMRLWNGTEITLQGQDDTGGTHQTNEAVLVSYYTLGASFDPLDLNVRQLGSSSAVDVEGDNHFGSTGAVLPDPIAALESIDGGTSFPVGERATLESGNFYLEVYEGDGSTTRFLDNDGDGTYRAADKNWYITESGGVWTLHLPGGIQRVFNDKGQMTGFRDGWGKGLALSYDASSGMLDRVEHDNGQALDFAYTNNLIASVAAGTNLSVRFDYTTNDLLSSRILEAAGRSFTNQYLYADGVMTNRADAMGTQYDYGYETDASGHLTRRGTSLSVDGHWYKHTVDYASDTLVDVRYEACGGLQRHRYGFSSWTGELTHHLGPGSTVSDAESRGLEFAYNAVGDKTEETLFDDTLGEYFNTFTDYDEFHSPTDVSVSLNASNQPTLIASTEWNHDALLPSAVENADGERLEFAYENGSLKTVTAHLSATETLDTVFDHYTDGLLESVTDANEHSTTFTYDSRGYPDLATPAVGPAVKTVHGEHGHLESVELLAEGTLAATGRKTTLGTTPLGWVEWIEFPDGLTVSNRFNNLGYVTNSIDRAGRATSYAYEPTRKLVSATRYLEQGGTNVAVGVSYDYDQLFNTLGITEPAGRYVETYKYNIQDRVVAVTNIENQVMDIDYGLSPFVKSITRFDGSVVSNEYEQAGRLNHVGYSSASVPLASVDYSYYPDGLLESISDGTSSITNSFDRLNRLTNVVSSVGNSLFDIRYSHDAVGNTTNSVVSLGGSQASATAYSFDPADRLKEISTTEGTETQSFVYGYNPTNGLVASVSNTISGIVCSYRYDIMDRVDFIAYKASDGSLIRSLDYAYNATSMIKSKTIVDDAAEYVAYEYKYDSIDRLVGETNLVYGSSGSMVPPTLSTNSVLRFNYDLAGNRTSVVAVDGIGDPATNTYSLGIGNRLASWGANGSALYNAAGCTTNLVFNDGAELDLDWDERYRLSNVDVIAPADSNLSSFVQYAYDVLDRRVSRIEGSTTNYFVYDGQQVVADLDGNGDLIRSYVWGTGTDNLLCFTDHTTSNTYYAIKDHLNSVIALIDDSGLVVESYEYDAYGNTKVFNGSGVEISESAFGNRYCFQGREMDWTTGLYYFRARWYNPEAGRWLSKDLIGIAGGLNQYVAFENNPVVYVDPDGTFVWVAVGAGLGAGIDLGVQLWRSGGNWSSVNWKSVGISAAAGALGGGLGTAVAKNVGTVAGRAGLNALGSALIGMGAKGANNALDPCAGLKDGVLEAGLLNGLLGGIGSASGDVLGSGLNGAFQNGAWAGAPSDLRYLHLGGSINYAGGNAYIPGGTIIGNAAGSTLSNSGPAFGE